MNLDITGRNAVVTGGASGIGAAVVRLLQEEGAKVSCWDLVVSDQACHSVAVDIAQLDQVEAAWQETEAHLGPVSILVHAAAIGSGHFGFPYTNIPMSAWSRLFDVNVMGMVNVAHVAGPAMSNRRQGAMVFISSVAGQIGSQTDPPYSASKAANINFAQCMAKDLAASGVRVNTVCPGMVRTPLNRSVWQAWADQQPQEQRLTYEQWGDEKVGRMVPLGRWQSPEDIASTVVFLCSERASEITGQTINVDGGFVMHW